jgi:hypothetical protein
MMPPIGTGEPLPPGPVAMMPPMGTGEPLPPGPVAMMPPIGTGEPLPPGPVAMMPPIGTGEPLPPGPETAAFATVVRATKDKAVTRIAEGEKVNLFKRMAPCAGSAPLSVSVGFIYAKYFLRNY